jgi:23S rRNA (cytidine1920-2'-O)/16S rRNA (cytidine1409-2'-O)-methyltransferase
MLDFSPVKGPEGNIEYLLYLTKSKEDYEALGENLKIDVQSVVDASHSTLDKEVQNG